MLYALGREDWFSFEEEECDRDREKEENEFYWFEEDGHESFLK